VLTFLGDRISESLSRETAQAVVKVYGDDLAALGVKTQDVLDTIETSYAGTTVGQTFKGMRTVDVVVLLPDTQCHQPSQLNRLMIPSALGPVPLSQVARLNLIQDRYRIEHDGGSVAERYVQRTRCLVTKRCT